MRFGEIRLGPRLAPALPFALPVGVPGDVRIPGGPTLRVRASGGPARSGAARAVAALPPGSAPLLVRTRRPGDRVFLGGRAVSLKRFLLDRKIPIDARPANPLMVVRALLFVILKESTWARRRKPVILARWAFPWTLTPPAR